MTHLSRSIKAGLLMLSLALGACKEQKELTEPTTLIAQSGSKPVAITDAKQLAELRQLTSRFHSLDAAKKAGYEEQITPCWAHQSLGAMGYHYGNSNLFDANVELMQPELLMYEPQAGGHMRLVGMEYLVPKEAWAAAGHDLNNPEDVPQLLGQNFTPHSSLPIFKLHIWLWRNNPSGTFADWNPKVSCKHAETTETF